VGLLLVIIIIINNIIIIIITIISRHITRYPIHEPGSNLVIKTSSRRCCCCCCSYYYYYYYYYYSYYIILQGSCPRIRVKACSPPPESSCSFFVVCCCYAITLTNYYYYYCSCYYYYYYYRHQSASSPLTFVISLKHVTDRTVQHPSVQMLAASDLPLLQQTHTGTKPLDRPRGEENASRKVNNLGNKTWRDLPAAVRRCTERSSPETRLHAHMQAEFNSTQWTGSVSQLSHTSSVCRVTYTIPQEFLYPRNEVVRFEVLMSFSFTACLPGLVFDP
jgi:hypothetical protein